MNENTITVILDDEMQNIVCDALLAKRDEYLTDLANVLNAHKNKESFAEIFDTPQQIRARDQKIAEKIKKINDLAVMCSHGCGVNWSIEHIFDIAGSRGKEILWNEKMAELKERSAEGDEAATDELIKMQESMIP